MHSFYNFTLTDVSLAVGTLIVAFLTCVHTYKKYGQCNRQKNNSVSSSEAEEVEPLQRQVKAVSFTSNLEQAGGIELKELNPSCSSFAPEEELLRYA